MRLASGRLVAPAELPVKIPASIAPAVWVMPPAEVSVTVLPAAVRLLFRTKLPAVVVCSVMLALFVCTPDNALMLSNAAPVPLSVIASEPVVPPTAPIVSAVASSRNKKVSPAAKTRPDKVVTRLRSGIETRSCEDISSPFAVMAPPVCSVWPADSRPILAVPALTFSTNVRSPAVVISPMLPLFVTTPASGPTSMMAPTEPIVRACPFTNWKLLVSDGLVVPARPATRLTRFELGNDTRLPASTIRSLALTKAPPVSSASATATSAALFAAGFAQSRPATPAQTLPVPPASSIRRRPPVFVRIRMSPPAVRTSDCGPTSMTVGTIPISSAVALVNWNVVPARPDSRPT